VQIVLSAQLNGVTLTDELINVNIVDPFLEIVDVRQKMGVACLLFFCYTDMKWMKYVSSFAGGG
jgi:hypothetical protein